MSGIEAIGGTPVTRLRKLVDEDSAEVWVKLGGIGSWPPLLGPDDFDEVIAVPEARAFAMVREAALVEGTFSGPSTGANLVAAIQVANRLGPGRRVVTVQVDSGLKYLNGTLFGTA